MFSAVARFRREPVELTVGMAFERRFRINAIDRRGLVFDTRFAPAAQGAMDSVIVYLLLDGRLAWDDGVVIEAPSLFVMREQHFEGAVGTRERAFRSWGEPFRSIELRVAPHECDPSMTDSSVAIPLETVDPLVAAGRLYLHASHGGKVDAEPDLAKDYLTRLHERRVLTADLGATITRDEGVRGMLWDAFRPVLQSFGGARQEVVNGRLGWPGRRIQRELTRMVVALGVGWIGTWREVALRYRLRVAVLLLSNPSLTVGEIAEAVGYSSVEALAHALESCGLPSASEVRRSVLAGPPPAPPA